MDNELAAAFRRQEFPTMFQCMAAPPQEVDVWCEWGVGRTVPEARAILRDLHVVDNMQEIASILHIAPLREILHFIGDVFKKTHCADAAPQLPEVLLNSPNAELLPMLPVLRVDLPTSHRIHENLIPSVGGASAGALGHVGRAISKPIKIPPVHEAAKRGLLM